MPLNVIRADLYIKSNSVTDLTKDKYQKYYNKCKQISCTLEQNAVKALDSGKELLFEEIADAVHDASAALNDFDETLAQGIQDDQYEAKVHNEGTINSRKESRDLDDSWAAFPEDPVPVVQKPHVPKYENIWPEERNDEHMENDDYTPYYRGNESEPPMVVLPKNSNVVQCHPADSVKHNTKENSYRSSFEQSRNHSIEIHRDRHEELPRKQHGNHRTHADDKSLPNGIRSHERSTSVYESRRHSYDRIHVVDNGEHQEYEKQRTTCENDIDVVSRNEYRNHESIDRNKEITTARSRRSDTSKVDDEFEKQLYGITIRNQRQPLANERDVQIPTLQTSSQPLFHPNSTNDVTSHMNCESYPGYIQEMAKQCPKTITRETEYATYIELLEKCLSITDGNELIDKLKDLSLKEKIAMCNHIIDKNRGSRTKTIGPVSPSITTEIKPRLQRPALPTLSQKGEAPPSNEKIDPEPLWRVKDDGGVSTYLGKFMIKGDTLFVGIHFTAYFTMRYFQDSEIIEACVDVKRNIHNLDMYIDLLMPENDVYNILTRTSVTIIFSCNPQQLSHVMPTLRVSLIESDGTMREIFIKLPIGPFNFLQPAKISNKQLERIMDNNGPIDFYTVKRTFLPKGQFQLYDLLSVLSRYFAITKTNVKQTLSAIGMNREVLVAALRTNGNTITLEMWSPNEKTLASASHCIKEIAAALTTECDAKNSNRALRTMSSFPLEFKNTL
uniref:Uncharacterized protein n=1 Tax=Babesia bovis TaxID=5865 RepID=A7AMQ1_BABBO|eukprot:XP_001611403.1 hypothetical protein [Babesia bovis T2Bo]